MKRAPDVMLCGILLDVCKAVSFHQCVFIFTQSCISRMRELSVVNIEESEVITLYFCLYAMGIYQVN